MSDAPPQMDFLTAMKAVRSGAMTLDECPDELVEMMASMRQISREELATIVQSEIARENKAPGIGQEAPDFELQLLGAHGKPSGESRRLSASRGRPVGLVFGSYT